MNQSMRENYGFKALYCYAIDGDIKVMLGSHVDDLIYGSKPGYEHLVDKVLEIFSVRKTEQLNFRFCGREWVQDPVTFDIAITCQHTTENIDLIEFSGRNRELTAKAGDGEIAQLRSVSGSVSWVARQARPDQSYHASRLQQYVPKAEVKHLKDANKIVGEIKASSKVGITFKGKAFDWNMAVLVTISDASFANEKASGTTRMRSSSHTTVRWAD